MNYRIGQELYETYADEDGKCEIKKWKVRTIRGGCVYAVQKSGCTWGKLSSKNGDFGWFKDIPDFLRRKADVGEKIWGLYTTRLQAWRALLVRLRSPRKGCFGCDDAAYEKALKTATRKSKARK